MLPQEYSRWPSRSYSTILLVVRSKVQMVLPDPMYSRCRLEGSALIYHFAQILAVFVENLDAVVVAIVDEDVRGSSDRRPRRARC